MQRYSSEIMAIPPQRHQVCFQPMGGGNFESGEMQQPGVTSGVATLSSGVGFCRAWRPHVRLLVLSAGLSIVKTML